MSWGSWFMIWLSCVFILMSVWFGFIFKLKIIWMVVLFVLVVLDMMYFMFGILLIECLMVISDDFINILVFELGYVREISICGGVIFGNCDVGRLNIDNMFKNIIISDSMMVIIGCLIKILNIVFFYFVCSDSLVNVLLVEISLGFILLLFEIFCSFLIKIVLFGVSLFEIR